MPAATSRSTPRPSALSKMDKDKIEDRKRPAGGNDDGAPPRKKLAVNGSHSKDDYENQPEEVWIEEFTRGAIYRRMQEYKREAMTYSARLEELHMRSLYHDDHIRIIDAWWKQLVEEIEVIVESAVPADALTPDPPYSSGVSFKDTREFSRHLDDKTKTIKSKAESLLSRIAAARGDRDSRIADLESQTVKLLAAQKEYQYKLEKLSADFNDTSEQLNAATLRYFKAEKKLDRVKSAQVQKLEQQALANATKQSTPAPEKSASETTAETNGNSAELLQKYEEECAATTRMKEQVQSVQDEIKALQEENSTLKARREALTDEDFIRTDVFKLFKSKTEDLIRQLNHLEATNGSLREEVERLNAERTNFKLSLEADAQTLTQELDADLLAKDQDLARLRAQRDELHAKHEHARVAAEQESKALEHLRELVGAKDDRISALEAEVACLRPNEAMDGQEPTDADDELATASLEDLRARCRKLAQDFKAVSSELPAMEKAYKKSMSLAHKKVMDFAGLEGRANQLLQQKNKSDQRYFDARKDADTRNSELRQQRVLNQRSVEIIAQLKDVESNNKTLLANLEKQLSDLRQSNTTLVAENKKMEATAMEASRTTDGLKKEITELKNLIKARDNALAAMREQKQGVEVETDRLRVKADSLQKDRNDWKVKAESNSSDVEKGLRTLMICSICNENFKNTALKTCGHLFCGKCVENRINNRMRKCPSCSRAFDKMDVLSVHH